MSAFTRKIRTALDEWLDPNGVDQRGLYVLGALLLWAGGLLIFVYAAAAPGAFPHGQADAVFTGLIVFVVAAGVGTALFVGRDFGRSWPLSAAAWGGAALIVTSMVGSHTVTAADGTLLSWPAVFSAAVLGPRTAAISYLLTVAGHGWALTVTHTPNWLSTLMANSLGLAVECAVLGLLRRRAQLAGARIERLQQRLWQLALTDPLTGLANRRALGTFISEQLERRGGRESMVLLAVDIDHFKQVNDRLGHQGGDEVLVHLAQLLTDVTRRGDMAARIGGEEFVTALLMPGHTPEEALTAAERLRAAVQEQSRDWPAAITVSVGLIRAATNDLDGNALTAAADAALYRAKLAGRNRVYVASVEDFPG